jgi:formate-dependent nitrite reductase cytochrome c552 subunit
VNFRFGHYSVMCYNCGSEDDVKLIDKADAYSFFIGKGWRQVPKNIEKEAYYCPECSL